MLKRRIIFVGTSLSIAVFGAGLYIAQPHIRVHAKPPSRPASDVAAAPIVPLAASPASQGSPPGITTEKILHWGFECWDCGHHDFQIAFNEKNPVRLKQLYGYVSSAPVPKHQAVERIIRQSLLALLHPDGSDLNNQVSMTQTPQTTQRFNQSVARNLLAINIKQTGAETKLVPVNIRYDTPIVVRNNRLHVHMHTQSYRYTDEKGSFPSDDPVDALNVEVHWIIHYEVQQVD
jgi:hypothetical protein